MLKGVFMKSLIALTIISLSQAAFSSEALLSKCSSLAEIAVKREAKSHDDRNGISAYKCELAPNRAVVICELSASKGNGAASDTYRAILNKSCTGVLRVDLIGEE
jgi:hypothetical protein